ncbi:MAG: glycosyltransferase [Actinomycetota bacterium]|nr:glycosyltransferase [Actinomycetota bacterium]
MTIDTVLVAYRSEDVIEDAVTAASHLGGKVVVVDHGDGASAERAEETGAVVVADPSNPGFGAGQNRGVARTSSPFVLLCNPDAEIVPNAITAGAAFLEAHPEVAAVQGVIVNADTGRPERSAGVELGPVHLLGRAIGAKGLLQFRAVQALARCVPSLRDHTERIPAGPVEVESIAATAILVRRAAFDQVGGFDESYFLYGEDLDLCRRLRAAGWTLVTLPEVWARHVSGASAESACQREMSWWQGTMQFAARWWGTGPWGVAVVAATFRWSRLAVGHPSQAYSSLSSLVIDSYRLRANIPSLASR